MTRAQKYLLTIIILSILVSTFGLYTVFIGAYGALLIFFYAALLVVLAPALKNFFQSSARMLVSIVRPSLQLLHSVFVIPARHLAHNLFQKPKFYKLIDAGNERAIGQFLATQDFQTRFFTDIKTNATITPLAYACIRALEHPSPVRWNIVKALSEYQQDGEKVYQRQEDPNRANILSQCFQYFQRIPATAGYTHPLFRLEGPAQEAQNLKQLLQALNLPPQTLLNFLKPAIAPRIAELYNQATGAARRTIQEKILNTLLNSFIVPVTERASVEKLQAACFFSIFKHLPNRDPSSSNLTQDVWLATWIVFNKLPIQEIPNEPISLLELLIQKGERQTVLEAIDTYSPNTPADLLSLPLAQNLCKAPGLWAYAAGEEDPFDPSQFERLEASPGQLQALGIVGTKATQNITYQIKLMELILKPFRQSSDPDDPDFPMHEVLATLCYANNKHALLFFESQRAFANLSAEDLMKDTERAETLAESLIGCSALSIGETLRILRDLHIKVSKSDLSNIQKRTFKQQCLLKTMSLPETTETEVSRKEQILVGFEASSNKPMQTRLRDLKSTLKDAPQWKAPMVQDVHRACSDLMSRGVPILRQHYKTPTDAQCRQAHNELTRMLTDPMLIQRFIALKIHLKAKEEFIDKKINGQTILKIALEGLRFLGPGTHSGDYGDGSSAFWKVTSYYNVSGPEMVFFVWKAITDDMTQWKDYDPTKPREHQYYVYTGLCAFIETLRNIRRSYNIIQKNSRHYKEWVDPRTNKKTSNEGQDDGQASSAACHPGKIDFLMQFIEFTTNLLTPKTKSGAVINEARIEELFIESVDNAFLNLDQPKRVQLLAGWYAHKVDSSDENMQTAQGVALDFAEGLRINSEQIIQNSRSYASLNLKNFPEEIGLAQSLYCRQLRQSRPITASMKFFVLQSWITHLNSLGKQVDPQNLTSKNKHYAYLRHSLIVYFKMSGGEAEILIAENNKAAKQRITATVPLPCTEAEFEALSAAPKPLNWCVLGDVRATLQQLEVDKRYLDDWLILCKTFFKTTSINSAEQMIHEITRNENKTETELTAIVQRLLPYVPQVFAAIQNLLQAVPYELSQLDTIKTELSGKKHPEIAIAGKNALKAQGKPTAHALQVPLLEAFRQEINQIFSSAPALASTAPAHGRALLFTKDPEAGAAGLSARHAKPLLGDGLVEATGGPRAKPSCAL